MQATNGLSGLNLLAFADLGLIEMGVDRKVLSVSNDHGFLHTGDVDHRRDLAPEASPNGRPGFGFEGDAIVANADVLEVGMGVESKGFAHHGFLEWPRKATPVLFEGFAQGFGFGG